ncbi:MAG: ChuX/HutX family heme-like substrate-binding protein [Alphaproteobacteria bacterium]
MKEAFPNSTGADLATGWRELRNQEPKLRIRDAAARLGVSELELLATGLGAKGGVTRLKGPWPEIIRAMSTVGSVMALTRNEFCVHERHGTYGALSIAGHVGLIVGEDIDLRIFFDPWTYGFSVCEEVRGQVRQSLQFFDAAGQAIHKIYATKETNLELFAKTIDRFRHERQELDERVVLPPVAPISRPDQDIDVVALRKDWSTLQDTHDFFALLQHHKVEREQAFRLAGDDYAIAVAPESARIMLEIAAKEGLPIMVFVGNPGMIQIHTGPVKHLVTTGPWLNVLDPLFNLHLREDAIASTWIVRKPTRDGVVTSLELFDKKGTLIVSFFGKRKPGIPEIGSWRTLAESLVSRRAA